ncbi:MAG: hypothetical protein ACK5OC_07895, partial [Pirellula sp.]
TPIDSQADNHTNKKPRSLANTIPCEIVVSVMEAWGLEPMTSMQCSHQKRLKTLYFPAILAIAEFTSSYSTDISKPQMSATIDSLLK